MTTVNTVVLLRMQVARAPTPSPGRIDADCRAVCAAMPAVSGLERLACSTSARMAYVYLQPAHDIATDELKLLASEFARRCPWANDVRAARLEPVFDTAGASAGQAAAFHYVVEMDPEAGWMPEISRWYDTEHMPGLAAVPGCIRAMRFIDRDEGPLSVACYDLVDDGALISPAWLAVRATPWSDIARPHFTNTRRTMFSVP